MLTRNSSPRPPDIRTSGSPTSRSTPSPVSERSAFPEGFVKEIVVDTPEGLSVNPEATAQCTLEQLARPNARRIAGRYNYLTFAAPVAAARRCECRPPANACRVESRCRSSTWSRSKACRRWLRSSPKPGPPSSLARSSPVNQHVTFTIRRPRARSGRRKPADHWLAPGLLRGTSASEPSQRHLPDDAEQLRRRAGHRTATSTPTGRRSRRKASTDAEELRRQSGPPAAKTCRSNRRSPFRPKAERSIRRNDDGQCQHSVDSSDAIANSYLKTAKVMLPEGMGLNPSSANGFVRLHRRPVRLPHNNPIAVPTRRRSAPSRCRRRRCRPTRSPARLRR